MQGEKGKPGFLLFSHCSHLLDDRLRKLLNPLGIHASQARFIHALSQMGDTSQRELALVFDITPASMSQMTKRLIDNGYVQLRSDKNDRRISILSVTTEGEQLLEKVYETWEDVDKIIIDAIGAEKAKQLFTLSRELRDALGGKAPGTASILVDGKTKTG